VQKTFVKTIIDPDFGDLSLMEAQADPRTDGLPPVTYRMLIGKCSAPHDCDLNISGEDELALISAPLRETFRRVMANIDDTKMRIATACLDMARKWADAAEPAIELDAPKLAALLRLDTVDVAQDGLTLLFLEDADIFGGNVLVVHFNETGEITGISPEG
jgi:hypothetical protein